MPTVDNLHQVPPLLDSQRRDGPVVQDEQLHPRQALQHPSVAAIAAGDTVRWLMSARSNSAMSLAIVLKNILLPSTDTMRRRDKAVSGGRIRLDR